MGSLFGRPYNRPLGSRLPPVSSVTSKPIVTHPFSHPPIIAVAVPNNDYDVIKRPNWNVRPNQWDSPLPTTNQRMNMTKVQRMLLHVSSSDHLVMFRSGLDIDAECQNDYMKIRVRFNNSFSGIIYSTGKSLSSSRAAF